MTPHDATQCEAALQRAAEAAGWKIVGLETMPNAAIRITLGTDDDERTWPIMERVARAHSYRIRFVERPTPDTIQYTVRPI